LEINDYVRNQKGDDDDYRNTIIVEITLITKTAVIVETHGRASSYKKCLWENKIYIKKTQKTVDKKRIFGYYAK